MVAEKISFHQTYEETLKSMYPLRYPPRVSLYWMDMHEQYILQWSPHLHWWKLYPVSRTKRNGKASHWKFWAISWCDNIPKITSHSRFAEMKTISKSPFSSKDFKQNGSEIPGWRVVLQTSKKYAMPSHSIASGKIRMWRSLLGQQFWRTPH